jgi:hypothetical protein
MQNKIIKYFIKSSPVGEVNLILKDVSNIVDAEVMNSPDIKQALKEYFESHRQQIKLSDGRMAMVSELGRQNPISNEEDGTTQDFVYFDQQLGVKFSFDPNTLQATIIGTESDYPEQLDEEWANYK